MIYYWCVFALRYSLKELHLSLNGLNTVQLQNGKTYPSIEHLYFNGNDVSDWAEICKLGIFISAETSLTFEMCLIV